MLQDELDSIKEIDYVAGREYIPEDALYRELLASYVKKIPVREQKIRESLNVQDLDQFMLEVHNLKSNSKAIGAMEMFQMARELEQYAVQKDIDRISQSVEPFLQKLSVLEEKMQLFSNVVNHPEGNDLDREQEISLLKDLKNKLETFDSDGAARYMESLWKFSYKEDEKQLLQKLEQQIDEFEYANAIELAVKLLQIAEKQK